MPNLWDFLALGMIVLMVLMVVTGFSQLISPIQDMGAQSISLSPWDLPYYAGRSVFRMFCAIILALIVTFVLGALAAKNRIAEKIIVPIIDVLQSIPVLEFLQISIFFAVALFPGQMLGVELAAIMAVFVAQAWNMILSFYQSLKSVPAEYYEMAKILRLGTLKTFWKVEVPSARPGLIFNAMLSLSASWFAVVEAEVIQVGLNKAYLPGIGSYIKVAQDNGDMAALGYAILTMLIVILLYDHLIFRPMQIWVARYEDTFAERSDHWLLSLLANSKLLTTMRHWNGLSIIPFQAILRGLMLGLGVYLVYWFFSFYSTSNLHEFDIVLSEPKAWWIGIDKLVELMFLGLVSALRIFLVLFICLLVWVPIGVYIGVHRKLAKFVQPLIQVFAAFPPNALYPVLMYLVLEYQLNAEIWVFPLIMVGAQWYILFNVIAGMMVIPKEYILVVNSLHCSRALIWKRLYLPAIYPYLVTGVMTAAGAAWNATIMAELFSWDGQVISVTGLGAYMKQANELGQSSEVAWSVMIMCFYVMLINLLIWQPLYRYSTKRFQTEE